MRVIPCLMLLVLASASAVQSQVRKCRVGYSLALPEGFTEFPEARAQKDVVDAWSEATPTSANGALVLLVARMHGVLPREAMRQEDVPANTQGGELQMEGVRRRGSEDPDDTGGAAGVRPGRAGAVARRAGAVRKEAVQLSVAGRRIKRRRDRRSWKRRSPPSRVRPTG